MKPAHTTSSKRCNCRTPSPRCSSRWRGTSRSSVSGNRQTRLSRCSSRRRESSLSSPPAFFTVERVAPDACHGISAQGGRNRDFRDRRVRLRRRHRGLAPADAVAPLHPVRRGGGGARKGRCAQQGCKHDESKGWQEGTPPRKEAFAERVHRCGSHVLSSIHRTQRKMRVFGV